MGGEGVGGICSVAITWILEEKESKKKKKSLKGTNGFPNSLFGRGS